MAIFATQHTKSGNIWPLDYLAIMPSGETKRFRLKQRDSKNCNVGTELQFINIDDTDTSIYQTWLEIEPIKVNIGGKCYDSINEHCTIDYNGITLQLKADICELACCNATWKERKEIIRKLKE